MRFTTKTEYGLVCMAYIAKHSETGRVTIREIAQQENYPVPYLEKILQALRQAKLVISHAGSHGGYALARPAADITLRHIIDALEGATFEVFCAPETRTDIVCTHFCLCGIKPVWRKTKQLLDEFYDSITLEMMTKNEMETQKMLSGKH